jgi:hypothetical protein
MALYSLALRTSSGTTGTAAYELIAGSARRPRLMEIGVFLAAATASTFGFGTPAAIGVTPTAPVTVLAEDPADPAGSSKAAVAWATPPTIPAAFYRRIGLPAAIGAGMIWTFPRGIQIPINTSLVLWNLAANAVADVYVVVDE